MVARQPVVLWPRRVLPEMQGESFVSAWLDWLTVRQMPSGHVLKDVEGLTIVAVSFGKGADEQFHSVNNEDELKQILRDPKPYVLYFNAFSKNEQVAQRSLYETSTPCVSAKIPDEVV